MPEGIYVPPREVAQADCDFYHVMDLPGVGRVGGQWDLRGHVGDYLGHVDLAGRRVLEIGPASGFLTCQMEQAGAEVTAVEVPDDPGWDFVPYPDPQLASIQPARREHMRRIKNSFWFTHKACKLGARLYSCDATALPAALGRFDVAVMAAVLLHTKHPLAIVESCSRLADTLVITDFHHATLKGPVCELHPTVENRAYDTWWNFGDEFFTRFLAVRGLPEQKVTRHRQTHTSGGEFEFFTIVARRPTQRQ
jgi:O-methyltransferase